MVGRLPLAIFLSLLATGADLAGPGGRPRHAYRDGEVLVKFREPLTDAAVRSRLGADLVDSVRNLLGPRAQGDRLFLVKLAAGWTVEEAVQQLAARSDVQYAQPNYVLRKHVNDPRFPELWGLHNTGQAGIRGPLAPLPGADIDWQEAWDILQAQPRPTEEVIVAVIDTGVNYTHPDLAPIMWVNPGEVPGNLLDDDMNGYVDDVRGYDFYHDLPDPFFAAGEDDHGTHVAGTIAASIDNGIGVVGVSPWLVRIMSVKFLGPDGGSTSGAISAINYAVANGATILNNSWGGGPFEQALFDAISYANDNGVLVIAAAGNEGTDNDNVFHYPSGFDLPNIISVAAADRWGRLADFSNWGTTTVDLAAPGDEILSTVPPSPIDYDYLPPHESTSSAAAYVTGAAAILRALDPNATAAAIRDRILEAVEPWPALEGRAASVGHLNLANALTARLGLDPFPPAPVDDLRIISQSADSITLRFTAVGDDGPTGGRTARYDLRYAPPQGFNFDQAIRSPAGLVPAMPGVSETMTVTGLEPETEYTFQLRVLDDGGGSSFSITATGATLAETLVFSDDMENGTNGWTATSNHPTVWTQTTSSTHSSTHSWTDSPAGSYPPDLITSLVSPLTSLSGASAATLTFWQRYDLESGYDFGHVEASADGTTWTTLLTMTGTNLAWSPVTVPLPYAGSPAVRIRFRLTSDSTIEADGWYVDDVKIPISSQGTVVLLDDDLSSPAGWAFDPGSSWGIEAGSFLADSPGVDYESSTIDAVRRATPLDLSFTAEAWVSFDLQNDLETGYDFLYFEASTDSTHWYQIGRWTGNHPLYRETFDLSRFAGQPTLWLRFVISTDVGIARDGVSVDNLRVDAFPMPDLDMDGAPDVFDCAPTDPGAKAVPGEILGLSVSGGVNLQWISAASISGPATVYDVMRGSLGDFPVDGGPLETCVEPGSTDTGASDATPPTGKGFYYLVRGRNTCGIGTYGFASPSGVERISTACP